MWGVKRLFTSYGEMSAHQLHLNEEALEQYLLEQLSPSQVQAVEEHLLFCGRCRDWSIVLQSEIQMLQTTLRWTELEERKRRARLGLDGCLFVVSKAVTS